jgi:hypothetical protein
VQPTLSGFPRFRLTVLLMPAASIAAGQEPMPAKADRAFAGQVPRRNTTSGWRVNRNPCYTMLEGL